MMQTLQSTPAGAGPGTAVSGRRTSRELSEFRAIKLVIIEGDEGTPGRVRVRGEFARADAATQNGRVYPRGLWEREIGRLGSDLKQRKVFGELDHPADGRTQLSRVSHVVTSLTVEDDGQIVGEAEILDTARGKDLKALLKSGCAVGVSSRGYGSTQTTDDGKEKVQEDYRLATFDFVAEPADSGAYPNTFFESKERKQMAELKSDVTTDAASEEELAKRVSAAVSEATEKVESQLREEFAQKLPLLISKVRSDIQEEVRGELLSDPAVAGAKQALEQVKALLRPFVLSEDVETVLAERDAEIARLRRTLAEKDLKLKSMDEEQDKLATLAKTTGYKYFLEKQLGNADDAGIIRASIGDVAGYHNLDSLKAKLESVSKEISEKRERMALEESKRQQEIDARVSAEKLRLEEQLQAQSVTEASHLSREKELTETVLKLNEALEKSMEATKLQGLALYAEREISAHPKASELRRVLGHGKFSTREEVDAIIESFQAVEAPLTGDDQESLRSRVRRLTRAGTTSTPASEETPKVAPLSESKDYNGLGLSADSIRKLSGLGS